MGYSLNSGAFWFVEGLLFAMTMVALRSWLFRRNLEPRWEHWLAIVLWFSGAGFALAFVGTSLGEGEYMAAVKGGCIFAVIAIVAASGLAKWVAQSPRAQRVVRTRSLGHGHRREKASNGDADLRAQEVA